MTEVDPSQFRQLLGRYATGVAVVTANSSDGTPAGMTVNSLTSVSLVPPLVSICVDTTADMHRVLRETNRLVLNLLAADQEMVSRRFAGQHHNRFEGIGYRLNEHGLAVLDGVIAHIECERHATFEAGDHTIYVARVTGGRAAAGRPLVYYRGGYTGLSDQ
jgi:flavin reductase (DIM6/NTAB) family NADH-FMN oxidoreductase RutF